MSTGEHPRDGLYLRLLGPLAVDLGGEPLDLGGRLRRALLADLALHANEVLSTDRLVEDLWGDAPPADPLNTLQVYVGQLRRVLEPERGRREPARLLVSRPPGYELVIDDAHLDVLAFETLAAAGHAALARGDLARGAAMLGEALALWRCNPLPEFADSPFAQGRVARLAELRLTALEARIEADLATGDPRLVAGELDGLTAAYPFRERLWELRMLALHRAGRSAEALRAYQAARQVLGEQLGIEPGPKLQNLDQRIAQRDPTLDSPRPQPIAVATWTQPRTSEPLVGRSVELARLEELLADAVDGNRVVTVVTAEAGFGKTRLVSELATRAWTRGCVVASGRCFEGESGAPFSPIVECLSELTRAVDPVALRARAERAAAIVARLIPDLHDVLGALPDPPPLPPEEDRARLFDGVARLVVAATHLAPTVLVLDDLQWADLPTLAVCGYLARAANPARLLIVGCYRPDEIDPASAHGRSLAAFEREGPATRIVLGPMTDDESSELVHDTLASDADPTTVAEIVSRAVGHPFFLRELARDALDGTLDSQAVPKGARELVLQRLHRLPSHSQRLAAAASVFDGPFDVATAAPAAHLNEDDALDALDALILGGMVMPAGEDDRFEFVHDIARQATYSTLTPPRRARLHRAVANAIEERWPEDAQQQAAASLARHYERSASLPGLAHGAVHAERAAAAAERAYAYSDAVRMLELCLRVLPPDDDKVPRLLARLGQARIACGAEKNGLAALLDATPRIAAAEGRLAAAETLAQAAAYAVQRGAWDAGPELTAAGLSYVDEEGSPTWAWLKLAHIVTTGISDPSWPGMMLGTPDQIQVSTALRDLPAADRPGAMSLVLFAFDSREDVLTTMPDEPIALAMWAGEYTRALELVGPMAEEDEDAGRIEVAIVGRCTEARCLNALGRFEESDAAFARGVGLLRRLVGPSIMAGHLLSVDEERSAAIGDDWGQFRVDVSDVMDHRALNWYSVSLRVSAARTLAHLGSTDQAMEHLVPALPAIDAAPAWSENYVRIIHSAAEVHWVASRDDHAALLERNAREKLLAPDFRYPMTDLRLTLARLVAVQGHLDEAAEWFDRGREVLDGQHALPLRAIVDHDQGVLEARMGHANAAHTLFTLAHDQATSLGMHGWARAAASAKAHLDHPRRGRS